jgi:GntP family gluconate:H+ symporter
MNVILGVSQNTSLLLYALVAVVGLVILIARLKLNAFIALIVASLFVGLCSRMELRAIAASFQEGLGKVLGDIAMVIALGTVLGKMLAESGGAEVIARVLIRALGEGRLHWTMAIVAFIVGIPVFFSVGFVLLVPILFTIARETKTPLMHLGIPMLAGLSSAHGFVPPHPGPMAAIGILNADVGKTIFYSLIIGFPTSLIVGPIFRKWTAGSVQPPPGSLGDQLSQRSERKNLPAFGLTLLTILLPILLMLLGALADLVLAKGDHLRAWLDLIGHPLVAMLLTVLLSFYTFGTACGFDRRQILKFSETCLGPIAMVLLVVGAGGGFGRVLVASGVANAIAEHAKGVHLSPLLLGWLVAALIRLAQGSATVAITTAAGIVAPMAAANPGTNLELLVMALGAGSSIFSHVNDGGFWIVKEYFGMTVPQTLRTWSVMVTCKSIVGLVLVLLVDWLV